jgi:drug/metabolite transporter (DMT)-like permease
VSTAAPLISMIALLVPVLVGVASGERPGLLPAIGIGAAVIAVVLISGGEGSSTPASDVHRPAVPFGAAMSGLCIGAFLVCLGRIGGGASLWPLVFARATGATAIVVAALVAKHSLAALQPPAAAWPPILGAGAADVVANLLYVVAAQRAPLSLVATIVSLAPATTVLLAQLLLRERLRARQGAGVGLALGAIVLLAQAR